MSPIRARDSFGTEQLVKIRVRRLGNEVGMVGDIVRIGLLEIRICCNLLNKGKLLNEVMALSVKSIESSVSFVTPKFSIAGILCPIDGRVG